MADTGAAAEPCRSSLVGLLAAATWLGLATLALAAVGERWLWFLELPLHFVVQYGAFFIVATAVLAVTRRRLAAIAATLGAVICLVMVVPLFLRDVPAATTADLRVVFFNVYSGNDELPRALAWLQTQDADIVVLAEVTDAVMTAMAPLRTSHPHVLAEPRPDNFGIALFSRLPLVDRRIVHHAGAEVPSAQVSVRVGADIVRVIGTHPVPPVGAEYAAWRDQQLTELAADIAASPRPTLVVGDLNCTTYVRAFRRFVAASGLHDSRDGVGLCWSWPTWCPPLGITIDHALVGGSLGVAERTTGPDLGSDHRPIVIAVGLAADRQ